MHGRPQAWARGGTCHSLEHIRARFASITTFWFAQKEPKSLSQGAQIFLNSDCNRGSAPDLAGELTALPRLPPGFKEAALQWKMVIMERAGQSGESGRELRGGMREELEREE